MEAFSRGNPSEWLLGAPKDGRIGADNGAAFAAAAFGTSYLIRKAGGR